MLICSWSLFLIPTQPSIPIYQNNNNNNNGSTGNSNSSNNGTFYGAFALRKVGESEFFLFCFTLKINLYPQTETWMDLYSIIFILSGFVGRSIKKRLPNQREGVGKGSFHSF